MAARQSACACLNGTPRERDPPDKRFSTFRQGIYGYYIAIRFLSGYSLSLGTPFKHACIKSLDASGIESAEGIEDGTAATLKVERLHTRVVSPNYSRTHGWKRTYCASALTIATVANLITTATTN